MNFAILDKITDVEIIAIGKRIRELPALQKRFGKGRWRKLKGNTRVKLFNGDIRFAEVHWYEAHGIGKKRMKIKKFLD